jgi:hypothetical protein
VFLKWINRYPKRVVNQCGRYSFLLQLSRIMSCVLFRFAITYQIKHNLNLLRVSLLGTGPITRPLPTQNNTRYIILTLIGTRNRHPSARMTWDHVRLCCLRTFCMHKLYSHTVLTFKTGFISIRIHCLQIQFSAWDVYCDLCRRFCSIVWLWFVG